MEKSREHLHGGDINKSIIAPHITEVDMISPLRAQIAKKYSL